MDTTGNTAAQGIPWPAGRGRLDGRIALVFGAGCVGEGWGNGKATAVAYAREGATVIAVDRNGDAAEETRAIIAADGGRCLAFAADVTREGDIARVVAETQARCGRIDVLHNNVGTTIMGGPVELTEAQWDTVLDVNLKSIFLTCR
ncbi:MAG TPA: SDR family NAD(P)-dependent oxidoreductase, partial [Acetobacteraceae bacterium]|nr:SDR family NAD(P)-dependent oxidoreductase [Acetobacteraceae bacterium]